MGKHLEPNSTSFDRPHLNRVRLGDLFAVLDVFFECARGQLERGSQRATLTPARLAELEGRGFHRVELLAEYMSVRCKRRNEMKDASRLDHVWVHHPPTDGSYKPQALPSYLV